MVHQTGTPLIVFVQSEQPRGDTVVFEQMTGDPRVLRSDHIHLLEHFQRAQGDIGEIPNRRRHYI